MSVVWVLETPKSGAISQQLIGDFAVRAFGSWNSFKHLVRLSAMFQPACLLVDYEDFAPTLRFICAYSENYLGKIPILCLRAATDPAVSGDSGTGQLPVRFLNKAMDSIHLVQTIRQFVKTETCKPSTLRQYRDITLDFEGLKLCVQGDPETRELSRKEMRLLGALLERPGQCTTREQLTRSVWEGLQIGPRTLDAHVSRLRKKLQGSSIQIASVYGGGYCLQ